MRIAEGTQNDLKNVKLMRMLSAHMIPYAYIRISSLCANLQI